MHFACQAWQWAGSAGAWVPCVAVDRRGCLCGRRGAWRHRPSLCVACMAVRDIDLHFVWSASRLVTSTRSLRGRCGAYGAGLALVARFGPVCHRGRRGCLCGRRGTWSCLSPCTPRLLCGRRGTWRRAFCEAGLGLMALGWLWWHAWVPLSPCSPRLFVWQAWHLAAPCVIWRGRRGRRGAWFHRSPFCMAAVAVALGVGAVDAAAVCVAGVALGDIQCHWRGRGGTW